MAAPDFDFQGAPLARAVGLRDFLRSRAPRLPDFRLPPLPLLQMSAAAGMIAAAVVTVVYSIVGGHRVRQEAPGKTYNYNGKTCRYSCTCRSSTPRRAPPGVRVIIDHGGQGVWQRSRRRRRRRTRGVDQDAPQPDNDNRARSRARQVPTHHRANGRVPQPGDGSVLEQQLGRHRYGPERPQARAAPLPRPATCAGAGGRRRVRARHVRGQAAACAGGDDPDHG